MCCKTREWLFVCESELCKLQCAPTNLLVGVRFISWSRSLCKVMATGSSEVTSPETELGMGHLSALHEALCPVSAKYKFFGLKLV